MEFSFKSAENSEVMQDIMRCLNNIIAVPEGSLPLMRGLGLDWDVVSDLPEELENEYATDLIEKVEEWEPRVSVENVEFEHDGEGGVKVNIELGRGEAWEDNEIEEDEEE